MMKDNASHTIETTTDNLEDNNNTANDHGRKLEKWALCCDWMNEQKMKTNQTA